MGIISRKHWLETLLFFNSTHTLLVFTSFNVNSKLQSLRNRPCISQLSPITTLLNCVDHHKLCALPKGHPNFIVSSSPVVHTVEYLGPSRTSMIELFTKIIHDFQPLTIFAENLHHRCSTNAIWEMILLITVTVVWVTQMQIWIWRENK